VLAGTVGGERLSLVVWLGILAALPGIWLVSSTTDEARKRGSTAEGLVDGILAGLGFGVLFAALGQIPAEAGLWPLAATQAMSIPAVILLALGLRAPWVPRGRPVWWALVAGPLGASATGAFLLATQSGFLTVAGVLASLYPATTVLLAALVLHEKIHRAQGVGLGLCALAIGLVAGG
jgi:drug/metabolite transporter (DMT)-like permease